MFGGALFLSSCSILFLKPFVNQVFATLSLSLSLCLHVDGCPGHMECIYISIYIYIYVLPVWKDFDKFASFEVSILLFFTSSLMHGWIKATNGVQKKELTNQIDFGKGEDLFSPISGCT